MIIIEVLNFLVLLFIALNVVCILNFLIKIAGDISSIQDYQSRKYAKIVAKDMKKKGYVMTEKGKELLKANTGKDI